jgi:hypothetical protein
MIRKLGTIAAAAGMAEQGDPDSALEILAELGTRYQGKRRKILTVARDVSLAGEPVEYALGLASRLRYDTLFLNIVAGGKAANKAVRQHKAGFQALLKDLSNRLWSGSGPDVLLHHAVLCGDYRLLLKEACHRIGGVALVILQTTRPEPCSLDLHVPVFCFDTAQPSKQARS